jgi:hypothetical protein
MQPSLGSRVILENGPISNVLPPLGLVDQMRVANICERTHKITVPQFRASLELPIDSICDFPALKIESSDHVIKGT